MCTQLTGFRIVTTHYLTVVWFSYHMVCGWHSNMLCKCIGMAVACSWPTVIENLIHYSILHEVGSDWWLVSIDKIIGATTRTTLLMFFFPFSFPYLPPSFSSCIFPSLPPLSSSLILSSLYILIKLKINSQHTSLANYDMEKHYIFHSEARNLVTALCYQNAA